jgi:hypothetical protein
VRRLDRLAETDKYLAELTKEAGTPSRKERERAAAFARRLERPSARKTG